MKRYFKKVSTVPALGVLMLLLNMLTSCEQTSYQPNTSSAPGGGTVATYKAYTLTATDTKNIYGRVVFYKYSNAVTLVEMGLYNGTAGASYPSAIYPGKVSAVPGTALKALDAVSGTTGEFAASKFFTINEAGFYDKLGTYNASVAVRLGTAIVASGNIGSNATPVAQSE